MKFSDAISSSWSRWRASSSSQRRAISGSISARPRLRRSSSVCVTWALSGLASGDEGECVRRGERALAQDDGSSGAQVEHGRGAAGTRRPAVDEHRALLRELGRHLAERARVGARRAGWPRSRGWRRPMRSQPRARARTPTRAARCAEDRPGQVQVAASGLGTSTVAPRCRSARARRASRLVERCEQCLRILLAREHHGRRLQRVASLELAQAPARLGLPGGADEAVDGVGRNDRAGAIGERGGERREVDARLGKVEAQRHRARIPARPSLIAGGAWPSGTRCRCHLRNRISPAAGTASDPRHAKWHTQRVPLGRNGI